MSELLGEAGRRGAAVGAFTVYNLETIEGVLLAAEDRQAPVILLVSSQAFRSRIGATLFSALSGAASDSPLSCCVQLDHEASLEQIERAMSLGFGAVMADGSTLPFDDNVAHVRRAVALAHQHGCQVEAELGRVAGDEEVAAAAARGALTEPEEASGFLDATGATCLAVSIGNVHGRYARPPQLDWRRLDRIRARSSVPLSLHGASGIADDDIRRAVTGGIAKVNFNTELRQRYFSAIQAGAPARQAKAEALSLAEHLSQSISEVVAAKLDLLEA